MLFLAEIIGSLLKEVTFIVKRVPLSVCLYPCAFEIDILWFIVVIVVSLGCSR